MGLPGVVKRYAGALRPVSARSRSTYTLFFRVATKTLGYVILGSVGFWVAIAMATLIGAGAIAGWLVIALAALTGRLVLAALVVWGMAMVWESLQ